MGEGAPDGTPRWEMRASRGRRRKIQPVTICFEYRLTDQLVLLDDRALARCIEPVQTLVCTRARERVTPVGTRDLRSARRWLVLTSRGHSVVEVPAGSDAQLGEHLAKVPFDGAGADE